ncbi:hypothetical protein J4T85_019420 [Sinorhizobium medicae]|uniref:hypothetical protein n=1 Tax=Sinorhizobium medicae TaxID=110321 RepID=UPI001AAE976A|nr:hypothetical protein [Sinorhizobium medicae]MBO1963891.1 hypothetical protein [Sinorhizobium medicae]
MQRCRVSHVTVYRMFNDIRLRLMHVGLYTHPDAYVDGELAAEEEGGPFFDGESLRKKLEAWMGKRRGIHPENRIAYAAQAIFDIDAGKNYVPAQLYRLILFAIKATGPLNRPPRRLDPAIFEQEVARIMMAELRRRVRKSSGAMTALASVIAKLERQIEGYLAELRAESAEELKPPPSSQTLH